MTKKEQAEKLKQEIDELTTKTNDLYQDMANKRIEREAILCDMILDDNMLANTSWEIKVVDRATFLYYLGDEEAMKPVLDLMNADYHSWIELGPGVELRCDEGDFSMKFDHAKQVVPFAKKNGMNLSGKTITTSLSDLKRQVAALEEIVHLFGL